MQPLWGTGCLGNIEPPGITKVWNVAYWITTHRHCFLSAESYQYTVLESLPVASVVAKLKAADEDEGSNAEMDYRIVDGDGPSIFNITTDEDTQEGVIILQKVDI